MHPGLFQWFAELVRLQNMGPRPKGAGGRKEMEAEKKSSAGADRSTTQRNGEEVANNLAE